MAKANRQQEILAKAKKKNTVDTADDLGTYAYTTQAQETFFAELHLFDQKA